MVRAERLRAVRLDLAGIDAPTVVVRIGNSRRSVQTWVGRYIAAGLPGLEDAPGVGGDGRPMERVPEHPVELRQVAAQFPK